MSKKTQDQDEVFARHLINDIFNSLWFKDYEVREILHESYVLNIQNMNEHAHRNHIDLRNYYSEIGRVLLNAPGLCELKRPYGKQR